MRAADTARLDLAPEAPGLLAASLGLSRMYDDDLAQLDAGMMLYDALLSLVPRRDGRAARCPLKARALDRRNRPVSRVTACPENSPSVCSHDGRLPCDRRQSSLSLALPGLSSARPDAAGDRISVATWLLLHSVPASTRNAPILCRPTRPISPPARRSFSEIARSAMVSTAADTRRSAQMSIRAFRRFVRRFPTLRTAKFSPSSMTAFAIPRCPPGTCPIIDIWQIVLFLRHLPPTAGPTPEKTASVAGFTLCRLRRLPVLPSGVFERWQRRAWPMSCVIRASIPTRSSRISPYPDPLLTFTKDDIAFVYGSRWKQRYFTKRGDDYFPLPAQWDVTNIAGSISRARQAPTGGRPSIPRTTCSARPGRCATAAIQSTTISRPRRRQNGMSAVKPATGQAVLTSRTHGNQRHQPGAARLCRCERHLRPLPFTGPSAGQSD